MTPVNSGALWQVPAGCFQQSVGAPLRVQRQGYSMLVRQQKQAIRCYPGRYPKGKFDGDMSLIILRNIND